MRFAIGMRNIKTALAVFICVLISYALDLEYPFYAAIATIIAMESSITSSYVAGKNRTMGTLVGAAFGGLFAFVAPHNALLSAIGIVCVIYVCNLLKWNKSVSIAGIVFLAIMLNLHPGEGAFTYALHRVLDTLLGIGVAVLVNYFVVPPKHDRNLERSRLAVRHHLTELSHELLRLGGSLHISPLKKDLATLQKAYDTYREEFDLGKNKKHDLVERIEQELDVYRNTYSHMRMIRLLTDDDPAQVASLGVSLLQVSNQKAESALSPDSQAVIYRYHVACILGEMQTLGLVVPTDIAYPFEPSPEAGANKPDRLEAE
ncbi:aromatic acid exporter family protein [Saccharibacillus sp. CPCC 101409]|uniref:FUSC family protein n=1 Tax=Saccharibacillus sp. CPCC 101409 TaxID=3058041 RepID=UPI0026738114|nr:aromatic acid exporter family protein [Saccharibacillus sp. CPCC 101409]MDO3408264.1 aromatic acid exporter family protein [Saccharibacillus sp. CPCC 101409]